MTFHETGDEMAVEDRRRLLEGLLWQLTGEQEHPP